ncbi:hypothetical protein [Sphingomonas elodea]|uniref:hypothetical protein n=1 Tax=Sphingomonas elodea TaxID=179878 RepID=UPI00026321C7|nr:hypothetical protein [Sphingomonas elodea]
MSWKHDELAADLAQHLRSDQRMVWTDMQLGPSGSPRPDVYTIERSYSRPMPTAYECKISRSDLRSDTTSGKWQKYLAYAGAVVFAVPDGLCTVSDIPAGCGLIVRKANVWRHVRKATRQSVTLPMDACMKLLIDGVSRTEMVRAAQPRRVDLWREHEAVRQRFGEAVSQAARDLAKVRAATVDHQAMINEAYARVDREAATRRTYLMDQAKKEVAEFNQARAELCEILDVNVDASIYEVRRQIVAMRARCDADARVEAIERQLRSARMAVEAALNALRPAEPEQPASDMSAAA